MCSRITWWFLVDLHAHVLQLIPAPLQHRGHVDRLWHDPYLPLLFVYHHEPLVYALFLQLCLGVRSETRLERNQLKDASLHVYLVAPLEFFAVFFRVGLSDLHFTSLAHSLPSTLLPAFSLSVLFFFLFFFVFFFFLEICVPGRAFPALRVVVVFFL